MAPVIDEMILVSEAARRLGLSAQRLRTLANAGRIRCVRTPFGRLFDPAEIERFRQTRGPFGRYPSEAPPSLIGKTAVVGQLPPDAEALPDFPGAHHDDPRTNAERSLTLPAADQPDGGGATG